MKLSSGDRVAVLSPAFAAPAAGPAIHEQAMRRLTEATGLVPVEYPTTRRLDAPAADPAAAAKSYDAMFAAYKRIFDRFGLRYRAVAADSGAIGGDLSEEFQGIAATGEDAETIEEVHEPFLLQKGYLQRTPRGRVATRRAFEYLGHPTPPTLL